MKLYLLDTDISSYIIKKRPLKIKEHLDQLEVDQIGVSVITKAELLYGVARSSNSKINRPIVNNFLLRVTVCPWDDDAAEHYAQVRLELERKGTPIGNLDTMIAAHARSKRAILVTNNTRHFKQVSQLQIENWV